MSNDMELSGRLAITDLKPKELEYFLKYIARSRPTHHYDFISQVFGDINILRFLDLMAGEVIKVPDRESLVKLVSYIQIYNYVISRLKTKEHVRADDLPVAIVEMAALEFGRRKNSIVRIYQKVDEVLLRERKDILGIRPAEDS